MKPGEALKLLDDLTAQIPLKRVDQGKVQEALMILRKIITPTSKKKHVDK